MIDEITKLLKDYPGFYGCTRGISTEEMTPDSKVGIVVYVKTKNDLKAITEVVRSHYPLVYKGLPIYVGVIPIFY
jgi:hypothetical protein